MSFSKARLDRFLAAKRIAVIGASRNEKAYSRQLFREFVKHGYDAVPVNPNAPEMDGRKCWGSVREINPRPDAAVIVLPESQREAAVRDCLDAGVNDIWVYGKVALAAVQQDAAPGRPERNVITGLCPFMFLPQPAWIHRFHAGLMKLTGTYPK
jgi:uncharacterized protein